MDDSGRGSRNQGFPVQIAMICLALLILPLLSPLHSVNGEARVESKDFGVLDELDEMLKERSDIINSNSISSLAEPRISQIRESVETSDSGSPISLVGTAMEGATMVQTSPPTPKHPTPYEALLDPSERPPAFVENIWQTLINITDYVIWTQYTDRNGNVQNSTEVVSFSASLISILNPDTEALLHSVDVDKDGDDDIQVGLRVDVEFVGGWGIEGDTLWIEPGIEYTIRDIGNSALDPDWNNMESLQVSLIKAFSYSDSGTILNLGEGETYVWVLDSRFTTPPNDFKFEVGIERFYFDLSEAAFGFGDALFALLTLGIGGSPSETGITFAAISSPYSLRFDNRGQDECPNRYNTTELSSKSSIEISCGVSAGFGYLHFSPPDDNGNRDIWEIAYIEARFHPNGNSDLLPREAELVIRTDSVLPTSVGMQGERSLTTIEYWADRRSDLHIHFHEDRSNLPPSESDGHYGNTTDSVGWFRGMPAGSLTDNQIQRIFRMLGSADEPELPGSLPQRLGLIIGIKNFTRDNSQNVDDPSLPINPAYPPDSLIVLRSVQSLEQLDYTSWFSRGGSSEDHRRIHIYASSIPTAVAVYGTFGLGGSSDADNSFDSGENIDFISKIMDSVIVNIVDVFLDVGNVLNEIPSTVVNLISTGAGGGIAGREITLLMTDNWLESRNPMYLPSVTMQIGSSEHPVVPGNHLLLAQDRGLGQIQTDEGLKDPLVPVAASINFSGLQAFSFEDSNISEKQTLTLDTFSNEPISFTFVNHDSGNLTGAYHQSLWFSDLPDRISVEVSPQGQEYSASGPIDSIIYTGSEGFQRQAARITGFPDSFSTTSDSTFSLSTSLPIERIEAQLSDSMDDLTMEGDHFLFHHDPSNGTSSLSTAISGISRVGWTPPLEEGAEGPSGMGTAFATFEGRNVFRINVGNAPTSEDLPLSVLAEIDPMPSNVSLKIPTGSESGPSLELPELNTSNGISGVAFFIGGFADLGRSVNEVLAGITTDISTGSASGDEDFSFGLGLDADSEFDLVVESSMGLPTIDEPEWVHGASLNSAPAGISEGYHLKTWIPNLPPMVDLSVSRSAIQNGQIWEISLGLEGWEPFNPELIISYKGVNGQDLFLTLDGLEVGSRTSVLLESEIKIQTLGGITETSTSTLYGMTNRLDWFHALLIDRGAGSRTEMMVQDIPESVAIQASIGAALSMDMTVPDEYRTDGVGVGSIMIQQMQWMEGAWWPATMFLTQVPGSMNLTTEPVLNFDITKNLAFQGLPILDFSSSSEGMSLYIEAQGRAINSRGDIVLLAEGLSDRLSVKPTDSYGLNIRSGGDGVEKLYMRATDIPTMPPIVLEEMEVLGEDLKSATVHIREIAGPYSVIQVNDIRGGRIVASARATADVGGTQFDLRGVMLDAQATGGVPSGTTLGVNGLASDLSLLNMAPGFSGSTSHIMAPEPLSSGFLTLVATYWRGK